MTTTLTRPPQPAATTKTSRPTSRTCTVLLALAAVAILLQGVWAGLFLEHGNPDRAGNWIEVHARGGEIALILVAAATLTAFIRARARRDLWLGGGVLTGLLLLEAYLGGLIRDSGKDSLTPVHIPLGLAIMGVSIWLLVRSRGRT